MAFEVQYSPLTAEEFQRRNKGYLEADVVPVWLLGHMRPHFALSDHQYGGDEMQRMFGSCQCSTCVTVEDKYGPTSTRRLSTPNVALVWLKSTPLAALMQTRLEAVHWIDPFFDVLATSCMPSRAAFYGSLPAVVAPIEAYRLSPQGLVGPGRRLARELQKHRSRHHELTEKRLIAIGEAVRAKRDAEVHRGKELLENFRQRGGRLPWQLTRKTPAQEELQHDPLFWKAVVWDAFIEGKVGQAFSYREAFELMRRECNPRASWLPEGALAAFLYSLRKSGFLSFPSAGFGGSLLELNPEIRVKRDRVG